MLHVIFCIRHFKGWMFLSSLQALGGNWLPRYLGHLFACGAALIHHFPTLQEPSSHPDVRPQYQLNSYTWLSEVEIKHAYPAQINPALNAIKVYATVQ